MLLQMMVSKCVNLYATMPLNTALSACARLIVPTQGNSQLWTFTILCE